MSDKVMQYDVDTDGVVEVETQEIIDSLKEYLLQDGEDLTESNLVDALVDFIVNQEEYEMDDNDLAETLRMYVKAYLEI